MNIKLKTVGVIATDMGKTLSFYRTLGLPIPPEADQEENYDFETSDGIVLGFLSEARAKQADEHYQESRGSSLNLQFMTDSAANVDVIYESLLAAGYESHSAPWDAFWGQRFGRVKDPDGRIVNIYADL